MSGIMGMKLFLCIADLLVPAGVIEGPPADLHPAGGPAFLRDDHRGSPSRAGVDAAFAAVGVAQVIDGVDSVLIRSCAAERPKTGTVRAAGTGHRSPYLEGALAPKSIIQGDAGHAGGVVD